MADSLEYVVAKMLGDHFASSLSELALTPPVAPTVAPQGTPGVAAYSYAVAAVTGGGKLAAASANGSTAIGAAALTTTNFNRVTWTAVTGARGYLVYRTAGGLTQGVIARVAPGDARQLDDTGLTGDGATAPTTGAGRVTVGQADPEDSQDYPSVVILPRRFGFEAHLAAEELEDAGGDPDDDTGQVVMDVGTFSGRFEIRVASRDPVERRALQARIQALFFASQRRGWIKLTTPALTIGGTVTAHTSPVAYHLSGDTWEEEFVFDKKRFSFVDIEVSFPALVVWNDAYTIEDYQIALTEDLTTTVAANIPIEVIRVDEDGDTSPV